MFIGSKDVRICLPVPLYHCFGMVMGSLQTLCHACTVVFPSLSFGADKAIQAIEKERCNSSVFYYYYY